MKQDGVKIKFFILEGIQGFDELTFREKCSYVVFRSEDRLQEDYYAKAIEGNFNKPWSEFKSFMLDYCTKQSLEDVKKYKEETWAEFMERLEMIKEKKEISEKHIIRYLRTRNLPQRIKMMLYSEEYTLEELIKHEKNSEFFENKQNRETDRLKSVCPSPQST